MTAESELPSTGSGRRAGGRDLVVRECAVMAAGGYLRRSSLCTHSCNRACQIVLPGPLGKHLRYPSRLSGSGDCDVRRSRSRKRRQVKRERIRDGIRALLVTRTRSKLKTKEADNCSRRDIIKQNYIPLERGVTECGFSRYKLDTRYLDY